MIIDYKELYKKSNILRKEIIQMIFNNHSGHPGGSLSCIDILLYLYKYVIRKNEDIFILSKGHSAPALYVVLAEEKYIDAETLMEYRKDGGKLKGHPSRLYTNGIELGVGSLGIGLSVACGEALAMKNYSLDSKVYVLVGDGELDEGSNWEAIMLANHYKLDNLVLIVDVNKIQLDGFTKDILINNNLKEKITSFGWNVIEIDGNKFEDLNKAFNIISNQIKPVCLLANTIKGKGVSFMENDVNWHSLRITYDYDKYRDRALLELMGAQDI